VSESRLVMLRWGNCCQLIVAGFSRFYNKSHLHEYLYSFVFNIGLLNNNK
jgi:hypothetical protein